MQIVVVVMHALFLSTLSLRRATTDMSKRLIEFGFLSTLSLRRATTRPAAYLRGRRNFYPRSPCGERLPTDFFLCFLVYFYPRSPCGERHNTENNYTDYCDFYPRSPCGERLIVKIRGSVRPDISIHALLAESDAAGRVPRPRARYFYPRSPCGERPVLIRDGFLIDDISIHALLAESDRRALAVSAGQGISIHALLAESDTTKKVSSTRLYVFLSTLSLRRATQFLLFAQAPSAYFYPRSPCGERLISIVLLILPIKFLSTLSLRRATKYVYVWYTILVNFYPRSPCGERLDYYAI